MKKLLALLIFIGYLAAEINIDQIIKSCLNSQPSETSNGKRNHQNQTQSNIKQRLNNLISDVVSGIPEEYELKYLQEFSNLNLDELDTKEKNKYISWGALATLYHQSKESLTPNNLLEITNALITLNEIIENSTSYIQNILPEEIKNLISRLENLVESLKDQVEPSKNLLLAIINLTTSQFKHHTQMWQNNSSKIIVLTLKTNEIYKNKYGQDSNYRATKEWLELMAKTA